MQLNLCLSANRFSGTLLSNHYLFSVNTCKVVVRAGKGCVGFLRDEGLCMSV